METLNFLDLTKYAIVIPRIQRDYAQGRLTERATNIRKDFVDAITGSLATGKPKDFNFVYGSENDNQFIPLDGQQRLTTLFLFHIYLEGLHAVKNDEYNLTDYKFSYATRQSSKDFCKELLSNRKKVMAEVYHQFLINDIQKSEKVNEMIKSLQRIVKSRADGTAKVFPGFAGDFNGVNLNEALELKPVSVDEAKVLLKKSKIPKLKTPSKIIKNSEWFFFQWEDDPTVAGMLVMLDEIHSRYLGKYEAVENAFDNLFNNKVITFQFQSLKKFTRTDDLFIKMNSRGLGLTDFEIFKSKLVEDFDNNHKELQADFKNKIDGGWNDFLWKFRNGAKTIDKFYERLLKFIIPAEAAVLGQNISKFTDELFERSNKSMRFAHNAYLSRNVVFSKDLLERLFEDLNLICTTATSPLSKKENTDFYGFNVSASLENLLLKGEQLSFLNSLMVYAWMRFRLLNRDPEEMETWIKTILYIIEDSNVDSSTDLFNALKGIDSLLKRYVASQKTVYEWLATDIIPEYAGISTYQVQEEMVKAKLRVRRSLPWADEIERAETNHYMNGQIGFLLECAGIASLDSSNIFSLDSSDTSETVLFDNFKNYLNKIIPLFDHFNPKDELINQHILCKALLVFGNYFITIKYYNIANSLTDRDYSWHALLNVGRKNKGRKYFKRLLDDPEYDPADIVNSLNKIAGRTIETGDKWRKVLAGPYGHKILKRSAQHFIHFENLNVRILHTTQTNGFHDELYSLLLYMMWKPSLANIRYKSVNKQSEWAGIEITEKFDGHEDKMVISQWDNRWVLLTEECARKDYSDTDYPIESVLKYLELYERLKVLTSIAGKLSSLHGSPAGDIVAEPEADKDERASDVADD